MPSINLYFTSSNVQDPEGECVHVPCKASSENSFIAGEEQEHLLDQNRSSRTHKRTPVPVKNSSCRESSGNVLTSIALFVVVTTISLIVLAIFSVVYAAFVEGTFALSEAPAVSGVLLSGCALLAIGTTLCSLH
ncbi:hypothetical protein [Candidatus Ichthyocystis hellenicum]|uniref:hypothetical protein n=1 Tax=Candidatus Ichthyocystis hellenicum TaxID=1561003 RepID=UPI000B87011E|nr:hypothetical protein [Candidatus Ichthyocystis hellenicum]